MTFQPQYITLLNSENNKNQASLDGHFQYAIKKGKKKEKEKQCTEGLHTKCNTNHIAFNIGGTR